MRRRLQVAGWGLALPCCPVVPSIGRSARPAGPRAEPPMSQDAADSLAAHDRRDFFRLGLARVVGPVLDYVERRLPLGPSPPFLRPPGALPEAEFLATCQRCGSCVKVCPADAIRPLRSISSEAEGTPIIDPEIGPCLVCAALECMRVCPSGALRLVEVSQIRMGLARLGEARCLRSGGDDCQVCIDRCPIGEAAIQLDATGRVVVRPTACVGCGVCQFYCPAHPKAIVVEPVVGSPGPLAG